MPNTQGQLSSKAIVKKWNELRTRYGDKDTAILEMFAFLRREDGKQQVDRSIWEHLQLLSSIIELALQYTEMRLQMTKEYTDDSIEEVRKVYLSEIDRYIATRFAQD